MRPRRAAPVGRVCRRGTIGMRSMRRLRDAFMSTACRDAGRARPRNGGLVRGPRCRARAGRKHNPKKDHAGLEGVEPPL